MAVSVTWAPMMNTDVDQDTCLKQKQQKRITHEGKKNKKRLPLCQRKGQIDDLWELMKDIDHCQAESGVGYLLWPTFVSIGDSVLLLASSFGFQWHCSSLGCIDLFTLPTSTKDGLNLLFQLSSGYSASMGESTSMVQIRWNTVLVWDTVGGWLKFLVILIMKNITIDRVSMTASFYTWTNNLQS